MADQLKTCAHGSYMPHYVPSGCRGWYDETCCVTGGAGGGTCGRCGGMGYILRQCGCGKKINGVCVVYCPGGDNK